MGALWGCPMGKLYGEALWGSPSGPTSHGFEQDVLKTVSESHLCKRSERLLESMKAQ